MWRYKQRPCCRLGFMLNLLRGDEDAETVAAGRAWSLLIFPGRISQSNDLGVRTKVQVTSMKGDRPMSRIKLTSNVFALLRHGHSHFRQVAPGGCALCPFRYEISLER